MKGAVRTALCSTPVSEVPRLVKALAEGVRAARDAVSGVNLDEEAAQMLRFQQAYQAAAQVIATADGLFQTLLDALRR
jgi:flagellar hook-associated protein 1 FlgK